MSEFGYIPESPEQSFGNNKGIFTPKDIYDLTRADKWTTVGSLELIETQTASSDSTINFDTLGSYNIHFLTYTLTGNSVDVGLFSRFSNDGGSSFRDSSYHHAQIRGDGEGGFTDVNSTSMWAMQISDGANVASSGHAFNGYVYYYNLADSTNYSLNTNQSSYTDKNAVTSAMNYGSGAYPVLESHTALNIFPNVGTISGTASLYGIRYA